MDSVWIPRFSFDNVINSINSASAYLCTFVFLFVLKNFKIYSVPMYGHWPGPVSAFLPPGWATGILARETTRQGQDSGSDPEIYYSRLYE